MKKNIIALLLSIVMTVGSISGTPVLAAETTAEEAVTVDEETAEETTEESEESTEETENAETDGATEDDSKSESAKEIEEELEQELTEEAEDGETGTTEETETAEDSEETNISSDEDSSEEEAFPDDQSPESWVEETEEAVQTEGQAAKKTVVKSGSCGENLTWTWDNNGGVLTISGTGAMYDYSGWHAPEWPSDIVSLTKTLVVKDGVTTIGADAFRNFSLTSAQIPSSVITIGDGAFKGCKFVKLTLPNGVTSIGSDAFSECYSLESIVIPASVTSIGNSAFYYCYNLKKAPLPNKLSSIGNYAFKLTDITSVTLPGSLTFIGNAIFEECYLLQNVTIMDGVTKIPENAFYRCEALTNIELPDSITEIGKSAFSLCCLSEITIPNNVSSIGNFAFNGQAYPYDGTLKSVTIPNSVNRIGYGAFGGNDNISNVYYLGTQNEWLSIDIDSVNEDLLTANIEFVEDPYNLKYAKVTGLSAKTYTGKPITPLPVVSLFGNKLKNGTDYNLSYKNNTIAGIASIVITGTGSYSGSITKSFTINKAANTITTKSFTRTYSTKAQTFSLGVKIKNGTPTYKSSTKSVTVSKAGKATVKAKFIGKATITITAPEKTNYSKQTKKITITVNPTKTALSSVTSPSAGKMTVKWKKNSVGTGYQIQYSTSSKFTSPKSATITKNSTLTKTIGSLAKGKKYYVRIRTYKTVGSKKFYSGWSAAKTVTIRK